MFEHFTSPDEISLYKLGQALTMEYDAWNCWGRWKRETPTPATKRLAKETKAFMAKTDSSLVDAVVFAGALEAKHYGMVVYGTLLPQVKARGDAEITELLKQNSLQGQAALEKITVASDSIARANIADQKEASTGTARTFRGVALPAPWQPVATHLGADRHGRKGSCLSNKTLV